MQGDGQGAPDPRHAGACTHPEENIEDATIKVRALIEAYLRDVAAGGAPPVAPARNNDEEEEEVAEAAAPPGSDMSPSRCRGLR